jgi:hypothetical protein
VYRRFCSPCALSAKSRIAFSAAFIKIRTKHLKKAPCF